MSEPQEWNRPPWETPSRGAAGWGLMLSLLAGVLALSMFGVSLYIDGLVAAEKQKSQSPPAPPQSLAALTPPEAEAPPATSLGEPASKLPASPPPAPVEPDGQQVTAAKVDIPTPTVADPWPQMEARLLQSGVAAPFSGSTLSFARYADGSPARNPDRLPFAIVVVGDLSPSEEQILTATREFLGITFGVPVRIHRRLASSEIPSELLRVDDRFNDRTLLSSAILDKLLAQGPDDAFATLAITANELYPAATAPYLAARGSARERVTVWSIGHHRNLDSASPAFRSALQTSLASALRAVAPIYGLNECSADRCSLHAPLSSMAARQVLLCPACVHKLAWNLETTPSAWLAAQQRFFEKYRLREMADVCRDWQDALNTARRRDARSIETAD
jgi:hypothetical protein